MKTKPDPFTWRQPPIPFEGSEQAAQDAVRQGLVDAVAEMLIERYLEEERPR